MLTPPFRAIPDPYLSLQAQQAQILGLITSGPIAPSERLDGGALNVRGADPLVVPRIPLTEELAVLEDEVVQHLGRVVPPKAEPRMLLLGPGSSMTDPLYALRFLAKLAVKADAPGELTAYDLYSQPEIHRYYSELPWGPNRARLEFGHTGNYKHLKGADAHLILAIHPGIDFETIFGSFAKNLVRGGIGIMQASVIQEFTEDNDYKTLLGLILEPFRKTLEFFLTPLRSRLFRSYFSERSEEVHVLAVRRK